MVELGLKELELIEQKSQHFINSMNIIMQLLYITKGSFNILQSQGTAL